MAQEVLANFDVTHYFFSNLPLPPICGDIWWKNPLEFCMEFSAFTQNQQGHGKQRQHSRSSISAKQSLGLQQQIEGGAKLFKLIKLPAELVRDAKVNEAELGSWTKSIKMMIRIKNVKNLKHARNAKIEDELMIHLSSSWSDSFNTIPIKLENQRWQASAGTSASPSVSARKSRRRKSGYRQNGSLGSKCGWWELAETCGNAC